MVLPAGLPPATLGLEDPCTDSCATEALQKMAAGVGLEPTTGNFTLLINSQVPATNSATQHSNLVTDGELLRHRARRAPGMINDRSVAIMIQNHRLPENL